MIFIYNQEIVYVKLTLCLKGSIQFLYNDFQLFLD